jgi:hypothetical protein
MNIIYDGQYPRQGSNSIPSETEQALATTLLLLRFTNLIIDEELAVTQTSTKGDVRSGAGGKFLFKFLLD